MYINEDDIRDRAVFCGMDAHPNGPDQVDEASRIWTQAEIRLEEEHELNIFVIHELTSISLKAEHDPTPDATAWKLMSGMGPEDECVEADGVWYYRDWEIGMGDGQWIFDNQYAEDESFCDVDLMNGLEVCDEVDSDPVAMIEQYGRDVNISELHGAMLDILFVRYSKVLLGKVVMENEEIINIQSRLIKALEEKAEMHKEREANLQRQVETLGNLIQAIETGAAE